MTTDVSPLPEEVVIHRIKSQLKTSDFSPGKSVILKYSEVPNLVNLEEFDF